tara:strand:+ start:169 stop:393 length:225 start_codon:yes stop_codon:yes gene_type:complete
LDDFAWIFIEIAKTNYFLGIAFPVFEKSNSSFQKIEFDFWKIGIEFVKNQIYKMAWQKVIHSRFLRVILAQGPC